MESLLPLRLKNHVICLRAKQTRDIFSSSLNNSSAIFDLIHCDLWGPYFTLSSFGALYFLTISDDHSRFVRIYLLAEKQEADDIMKKFFVMVQT